MGLRRRSGLRFVIEVVAIVLAALVAGLLHLDAWAIAATVAVVWLLAALVEYSLAHQRRRGKRPAPERAEPAAQAPEAAPVLPAAPEPQPEPLASEGVRVIRRDEPVVAVEAPPEPEPVPEPVPEAEPEPEPEPEPVAAVPPEPRQWNIWDLERALKEGSGASEDAGFLLLYLRDFADAEGLLPLDFDGLVRESFGDALGALA
ncbi:MAG TPA: hypothetical protein VHC67_17655 [Gaiellaceae bacterium]|nr:hypothetical protein [Gaiellaceae bacterium]